MATATSLATTAALMMAPAPVAAPTSVASVVPLPASRPLPTPAPRAQSIGLGALSPGPPPANVRGSGGAFASAPLAGAAPSPPPPPPPPPPTRAPRRVDSVRHSHPPPAVPRLLVAATCKAIPPRIESDRAVPARRASRTVDAAAAATGHPDGPRSAGVADAGRGAPLPVPRVTRPRSSSHGPLGAVRRPRDGAAVGDAAAAASPPPQPPPPPVRPPCLQRVGARERSDSAPTAPPSAPPPVSPTAWSACPKGVYGWLAERRASFTPPSAARERPAPPEALRSRPAEPRDRRVPPAAARTRVSPTGERARPPRASRDPADPAARRPPPAVPSHGGLAGPRSPLAPTPSPPTNSRARSESTPGPPPPAVSAAGGPRDGGYERHASLERRSARPRPRRAAPVPDASGPPAWLPSAAWSTAPPRAAAASDLARVADSHPHAHLPPPRRGHAASASAGEARPAAARRMQMSHPIPDDSPLTPTEGVHAGGSRGGDPRPSGRRPSDQHYFSTAAAAAAAEEAAAAASRAEGLSVPRGRAPVVCISPPPEDAPTPPDAPHAHALRAHSTASDARHERARALARAAGEAFPFPKAEAPANAAVPRGCYDFSTLRPPSPEASGSATTAGAVTAAATTVTATARRTPRASRPHRASLGVTDEARYRDMARLASSELTGGPRESPALSGAATALRRVRRPHRASQPVASSVLRRSTIESHRSGTAFSRRLDELRRTAPRRAHPRFQRSSFSLLTDEVAKLPLSKLLQKMNPFTREPLSGGPDRILAEPASATPSLGSTSTAVAPPSASPLSPHDDASATGLSGHSPGSRPGPAAAAAAAALAGLAPEAASVRPLSTASTVVAAAALAALPLSPGAAAAAAADDDDADAVASPPMAAHVPVPSSPDGNATISSVMTMQWIGVFGGGPLAEGQAGRLVVRNMASSSLLSVSVSLADHDSDAGAAGDGDGDGDAEDALATPLLGAPHPDGRAFEPRHLLDGDVLPASLAGAAPPAPLPEPLPEPLAAKPPRLPPPRPPPAAAAAGSAAARTPLKARPHRIPGELHLHIAAAHAARAAESASAPSASASPVAPAEPPAEPPVPPRSTKPGGSATRGSATRASPRAVPRPASPIGGRPLVASPSALTPAALPAALAAGRSP
ncbi:hypothetical protein CXG81DRAFT_21223 [Caulochytrium protostelioides]|uniref:Uncharacterized protein n=2 Tax=Caulochytrium protostelioides TaxID=1555241 RepID=A0A4P9X0P2_9FUNG|nr:hypothetical protein CXG81DRAFT_21223 [Caulochytrium protostelioides]|eukprot:RKO98562.1 hypothetical protein CXG81DRAFT_21223 [Caulochytrium protostelioides]